jgi:hypothetical protein
MFRPSRPSDPPPDAGRAQLSIRKRKARWQRPLGVSVEPSSRPVEWRPREHGLLLPLRCDHPSGRAEGLLEAGCRAEADAEAFATWVGEAREDLADAL